MATSRKQFITVSIFNLMMCILLGLLCFFHDRLDGFLSAVLPMLVISELLSLYTIRYSADIQLCGGISFLYMIGVTLQVMIGSEGNLVLFSLLSAAFAVAMVAVYSLTERISFDVDRTVFIALGIIGGFLLLCTVILRLSRPISGTYAWIHIGGMSLQVTEFFKPAFVFFHAILFASSLKNKWLWSTGCTAFVVLALVLLNELGTMLVIVIMWLLLSFLFLQKKRITGIYASVLCAGGLFGWLILHLAKNKASKNAELGVQSSGLIAKLSMIYNKLEDRFAIWTSLDEADPFGVAHQAIKAREAMIKGGFFGTTESVNIPVESSDYAFVALLLRCGIIFSIVVLLLFGLIYVRGVALYLSQNNIFDCVTIAGCTYSLIIPLIVNVAGTTNVMPMTGVAIPFLSSGGTSLLLSFFLAFLMLWVSGRKPDLISVIRKINKYTNGTVADQDEKPFTR